MCQTVDWTIGALPERIASRCACSCCRRAAYAFIAAWQIGSLAAVSLVRNMGRRRLICDQYRGKREGSPPPLCHYQNWISCSVAKWAAASAMFSCSTSAVRVSRICRMLLPSLPVWSRDRARSRVIGIQVERLAESLGALPFPWGQRSSCARLLGAM